MKIPMYTNRGLIDLDDIEGTLLLFNRWDTRPEDLDLCIERFFCAIHELFLIPLSRMNRFSAQVNYTVLDHTLLGLDFLTSIDTAHLQLPFFLHDLPEAILTDIPSPVQKALFDSPVKRRYAKIEHAIYRKLCEGLFGSSPASTSLLHDLTNPKAAWKTLDHSLGSYYEPKSLGLWFVADRKQPFELGMDHVRWKLNAIRNQPLEYKLDMISRTLPLMVKGYQNYTGTN